MAGFGDREFVPPPTSAGCPDAWEKNQYSSRQAMINKMLARCHMGRPYLDHREFDGMLEVVAEYGTQNFNALAMECGIPKDKVTAYLKRYPEKKGLIEDARHQFRQKLAGASLDDMRAMMREELPTGDRVKINKFFLERVHVDFKEKKEIDLQVTDNEVIWIVDDRLDSDREKSIDVDFKSIAEGIEENEGTGSLEIGVGCEQPSLELHDGCSPMRSMQMLDRSLQERTDNDLFESGQGNAHLPLVQTEEPRKEFATQGFREDPGIDEGDEGIVPW